VSGRVLSFARCLTAHVFTEIIWMLLLNTMRTATLKIPCDTIVRESVML
jgi:hypothetical protein